MKYGRFLSLLFITSIFCENQQKKIVIKKSEIEKKNINVSIPNNKNINFHNNSNNQSKSINTQSIDKTINKKPMEEIQKGFFSNLFHAVKKKFIKEKVINRDIRELIPRIINSKVIKTFKGFIEEDYFGDIISDNIVVINSPHSIEGTITYLIQKTQTEVFKHEVIVRFENYQLQTEKKSILSEITHLKKTFKSQSILFKNGGIKAVDLSNIKNKLAQEKQKLRNVQNKIKNCTIKSPIDGVIRNNDRYFIGQNLRNINQNILTIEDDRNFHGEFLIPNSMRDKIGKEHKLMYNNNYYNCYISVMSPDSYGDKIKIHVKLLDQKICIPLGEKVQLLLSVGINTKDLAQVPDEAIITNGLNKIVFKILGNRAVAVPVVIIKQKKNFAIVKNLKDNDVIIVSGVKNIQDGEIILENVLNQSITLNNKANDNIKKIVSLTEKDNG